MSQRIDAVRNRKALIAAAEHVFAHEGPDAPLDLVARRAHVGRGTLYRHFRDRIDLAAAVYEEHLGELESFVAERAESPQVALELLTRITELQGEARGIQPVLLRAANGRERLAELNARTRLLLEGPLRVSQEAGELSEAITVEDLLLVIAMIEGALGNLDRKEAPVVARRALSLLLPALRGGPAAPLAGFGDAPGTAAAS